MSLKVSQERDLKRKSKEQLRQSESDEEARQTTAQIEKEIAKLRIERSARRQHYVRRDIRRRRAPFCCECQGECEVEGHEGGGQCRECNHHRCLDCWAGPLKGARKADEKAKASGTKRGT